MPLVFVRSGSIDSVRLSQRLVTLVLLSGVCLLQLAPMSAQTQSLAANRALVSTGPHASPPSAQRPRKLSVDATATIDLGTAQAVTAYCRKGNFDRVGLRHDQTVDIAVQYSAAPVGQAIIVEALDGGQVIAPTKNLIVGTDGTIHFKFRAGHQPGIYQIALNSGARQLGLQFWVMDEEHPRNNPPVVNSGN